MVLNFKKVILHNFASYSHTEIPLNNRGFCLVSGRNLYKKDNSYSNGSGKSFIWSGICYTLTGETIGGIRSGLKNLFTDEDSAYTKVEFSVNNDDYEITRVIAPKSDLYIIKNGVDVSGKGITESKKKLEELLPDLNKDLIASTFIIGQGMPNAFSKFSPSGRKEVLERLTKSDFMIDEVKKRIVARMDALNIKMRAHEDLLLVNNTKLADLNNAVAIDKKQLSTMIKPDFAAEAKKLNDLNSNLELQLTALTNLITTKLQEQSEIDNELMTINSQMAKEIAEVNENYNKAVAGGYAKKSTLAVEYNTLESDIRNLSAEISKIKNIKEFCPTCGQKLIGVEKPSTTELEVKLQQKQAEAKIKQSELVNVNTQLSAMDTQKTQFLTEIKAQFSSQLTPLTTRKQTLPGELSTLRTNQNIISTNIATNKAQLARLDAESKSWDEKYAALQHAITENEKLIASITATVNEELIKKLDTEEHLATIKRIDTLAKRDLRGHLLTNIITHIDKKIKDFSEIVFGTRELSISLAGNALEISYCGKMFDNLSGGEKMRVDLILQLAIRDMLKASLNTHANILVLDEITDFLDKQSCKAVMSLIEKELTTVESVFIISHHTTELGLPIDTELKIVKNSDGISMLE